MKPKIALLFLACLIGLFVLLAGCASTIPHTISDRKNCISCHGQAGIKPYPKSHARRSRGNDTCMNCHDSKIKTEEMGVR